MAGKTATPFIYGLLRFRQAYEPCLLCKRVLPSHSCHPGQKTLMSVVGLLPANLFLAANYSYDFWLTSLLALGVAMLIREFLDDTPLATSRCFALFFVFFMALAPKAVYFQLLALLLLTPRTKFVSDRQRRLFYLTGVLAALLAVATFALPLFATGGGSGDARGGSGINTSAQVSYILAGPVGAAYVICRYMVKEYLTVANIDLSLMNSKVPAHVCGNVRVVLKLRHSEHHRTGEVVELTFVTAVAWHV